MNEQGKIGSLKQNTWDPYKENKNKILSAMG